MSTKVNQSQINGLLSPILQKMRIINAKPYFSGNRFLDIGSSLGEIIKYLPLNSEYVGIEGNKIYYGNAKKLYPDKQFINLYLDRKNVKYLPVNGKFDTIIMLAILEHVDHPADILSSLKKFLSDKGVIIVSTPNKTGNAILNLGSKIGLFMNEMDEHRELFTKKRLFDMAQKSGYKVVHYHSFELGMNHLMVLSK